MMLHRTDSTQSDSTMTQHDHTSFHSTGIRQTSAVVETTASACTFSKVLQRLAITRRDNVPKRSFPRLPQTSQERLDASSNEAFLDVRSLCKSDISAAQEKGKTVLYLAYGSNLCNETFRGVRGIKPLSQVNVIVPELRLTFDLPGIPYSEPCFANSARRDPEKDGRPDARGEEYHKDRWHKGMVGVVYEVTPSDYAHIIATEGGGSSYKDILVTCYPLPESETVPESPSTPPFKAHTLFAPAIHDDSSSSAHTTDRLTRPDPSYAQPSARYLKLITDGAIELSLPAEYQAYLRQIRPYTITRKKQAVGKALFAGIWMPFLLMIFGLSRKFADEKGRTPKWLATLSGWFFISMWANYDMAWKRTFGDGERTEGQGEDSVSEWRRRPSSVRGWTGRGGVDEKENLLV